MLINFKRTYLHFIWLLCLILNPVMNFFNIFFFYFFFLNFIYLFYLWLCLVFVSVRGLSPFVACGGHSSSRCAGLSPSQRLLLRNTGSRRAGSVTVAHGPSRSAACGIFPDQGSNPCPLHWQADSQPLRHQRSPPVMNFNWKDTTFDFLWNLVQEMCFWWIISYMS